MPRPGIFSTPQVFLTRLHVRYDNAHVPEDLVFQETADRDNFQARYVLRYPWTGDATCAAADRYRFELPQRQEREAQTLAPLTGWPIAEVRKKTGSPYSPGRGDSNSSWWQRLWR